MSGRKLLRYGVPGVAVTVVAALAVFLPSRPGRLPQKAADPVAVPGTPVGPGRPAVPGADVDPSGAAPAAPGPGAAPNAITPGLSSTGTIGGGGDRSHCTPDGRQFGIIYRAPPCVGRWPAGADNGGATATGVTRERVRIVIFEARLTPILNDILAADGLSFTEPEMKAFHQAAQEFLGRSYETYGRSLEFIRYRANCPYVPPQPVECLQAARDVVRMKPFLVAFGSPVYPAVFDEWARAGIVTVGGWNFEAAHFTDRRPFRYDLYMDGTASARLVGEYYCKKLAGRPASHAGTLIHSSIGRRDSVRRRLGIIVPEAGVNLSGARVLADMVSRCDDGPPPTLITYDHDLGRAALRAATVVGRLVADGVTTVVCLCDPVFPAITSPLMSVQAYFPEHLLAGSGLLDVDRAGRLFDGRQWAHAFGLSHLAEPLPHSQTDAALVWRAVGRRGDPCFVCNAVWGYYNMVASLIQMAGPQLDPHSLERGAFAMGSRGGWAESRGRAEHYLTEFGPGDYTWISDAREVYWSATARSPTDGRSGAYVAVDGGRRYRSREWPSTFAVPVPGS